MFRPILRRTGLLSLLALGCIGLGASQPRAEATSSRTAWRNASFPVENFQAYTSPFGWRTGPDGQAQMHYGLDLAAPEGSYVRNWWSGQVVEVDDQGNCGTMIRIRSGDYDHAYCHLQGRVEVIDGQPHLSDRTGGLLLKVGQRLRSGQRIGRVGMTGRTTGPHLHWGIRYNGQWLDPGVVLRAMYGARVATRFNDNGGSD